MKILSSEIQLGSERTSKMTRHVEEKLNYWNNRQSQKPSSPSVGINQDRVLKTVNPSNSKDSDLLPPKLAIVKILLERIFGIDIELVNFDDNVSSESEDNNRQGWGLEYNYSEIKIAHETVKFRSNGTVTTENGSHIQFNLDLRMSKTLYEETHINLKAGDALLDPLVINYDGQGTRLTDSKTSFDIDMDGAAESISFVSEGSGFLALDKNGNGVIDNGSELFGPTENNGFSELEHYDEDGNRWIDENDRVFFQLSLWEKQTSGQSQLTSLKDRGIGAIFLNRVKTDFDLPEGRIRESGIYLNENGSAGIVQEVDLVVGEPSEQQDEDGR